MFRVHSALSGGQIIPFAEPDSSRLQSRQVIQARAGDFPDVGLRFIAAGTSNQRETKWIIRSVTDGSCATGTGADADILGDSVFTALSPSEVVDGPRPCSLITYDSGSCGMSVVTWPQLASDAPLKHRQEWILNFAS